MLKRIIPFIVGICLFFVLRTIGDRKIELSEKDFLFCNYDEIAISTDLEPDDVLALAILFEEANRLYKDSSNNKYPIDLIVIGEGNTKKKRAMLERLLQEYFDLPKEVIINIVESKEAATVMVDWASRAEKPFIIQLKPAQELLYFDEKTANKTTVLFYGGYNIRQTILDPEIRNDERFEFVHLPNFSSQLEGMMTHLASRFSKIAVLETFGTLGDQACVCSECSWTQRISEIIENPNDKFIKMFQTFSSSWNSYILEEFLPTHSEERAYRNLGRKILNSNVQFTLADILVAIATTDKADLFQTIPVKPAYDENGFLIPVVTAKSNLVYYKTVDRLKVADRIEQFLKRKATAKKCDLKIAS
jgi:hypothetical protein